MHSMKSTLLLLLWLLLLVTSVQLIEQSTNLWYAQGNLGSSGSGSADIANLSLPVCMENELVTFNGTDLICRTIPERRCNCPGLEFGSGIASGDLFPQPPEGCPIFLPPERGAFACLSMGEFLIFCSVLCDNTSEFNTSPFNPFSCGVPTLFEWVDSTNFTYTELPKCTGFRHRGTPLHDRENYLTTPCNDLGEEEITTIRRNLCDLIQTLTYMACDDNDVFVQCPAVTPPGVNKMSP